MPSLKQLALISGFAAMTVIFVPVPVAAQLASDGEPRPTAKSAPTPAKDVAPPPSHDAPLVRPAAAAPPERIQVEPAPGLRPSMPPQEDPRSVEEDKREPDATDR